MTLGKLLIGLERAGVKYLSKSACNRTIVEYATKKGAKCRSSLKNQVNAIHSHFVTKV
jgi:hypothetical protein